MLIGFNQRINIAEATKTDLVVFDLGIERSHFQVQEFRSLHLMTTSLHQRSPDEIDLKPAHLVVKVETVLDRYRANFIDRLHFKKKSQDQFFQRSHIVTRG